jgi:radical SAM protein with 4Fe4S-binding SPASM domain
MKEYIDKLGYKPRICVWELTLACNASCRHCGSHAGKPRERELDTSEAVRVAGELAALGCEHVTLSGGEPLLRQDWPLIAESLVCAGVSVGMISNGFAFDAAAARAAKEAGLTSVAFSVDGLEAVHDRMRGRPGSFRRTMAAFHEADAAGVAACAVTHVHRGNIDDLEEMHGLLAGLGVRSWKLQLCNPAGEAAALRDEILRPRDLLRLVPQMLELRRRGSPFVEASDSIGYFGPHEQELRRTWRAELPFWTGCYAGCRAIGLESNGNVKGCLALPSERHGTSEFIEGNVRAMRLADIWARPGGFAYNRAFEPRQLTGFCRTCPYAAICRGGCHWTALAHGGTLTENRFCYYRVSVEAQRRKSGVRRWFVEGLAPAAIVGMLGVTGCWDSYQQWVDEPDAISPTDVPTPSADADVPTPSADADVPPGWYGPEPVDAEPDVTPGMYGPPPFDGSDPPVPMYGPPTPTLDAGSEADVHCPTYEEYCLPIAYGPLPVLPPGCPDPCISNDYGDPPPVPDAGDVATLPDGAACPDPCGEVAYYGPLPVYPPGCPYECGSPALCPTNPCCDCDYGIPPEVPPECQDPCAGGK